MPFQKQKISCYARISVVLFATWGGICFGQTTWEWRNPLPQGNDLNSITFGNGRFVAVGTEGTVISSSNGRLWEVEKTDTFAVIQSVLS